MKDNMISGPKILVIGPSWVGDMVMSQSLYKRILSLYPDAKIDVLAPSWCKPILERMPEAHNAIEMPIGHGSFNLSGRWKIGRKLATMGYTHAIIQPNSAKSALIPLFAGIKTRTGWKGEMRFGLLNDLRPDRKVFQYMVERYVALAHSTQSMLKDVSINTIEFPALRVDQTSQARAMERLGLEDSTPIIGLCPGAEFGPAKKWPSDSYAQAATALISQGNQVWLFGSAKDRTTCDEIVNAIPPTLRAHCHNLAGETSLIEAVDLLAACHTVISNDSGLMHVAAAVGCNIIAIYGSSSPKYTPPLTAKLEVVNIDIDCRPCFKRECPLGHLNCLKELSPDLVLSAYKNLKNKNITMT